MDKLAKWGAKWGVPGVAIADLRRELTAVNTDPKTGQEGQSEAAVQRQIRLEASRNGFRLWRNNVGAAFSTTGALVRFGLANDSAAVSKCVKSADLIGIKPVRIEFCHVGHVLGQFVAREVKLPGWQYTGKGREPAQKKFLDLVTGYGGDAGFCTNYDFGY